jgi:hypothetical protein
LLHTSLWSVFFKHGTIKHTLAEFCDLSIASDSVNDTVLEQKLKFYGIQGKLLGWSESYLGGKKQRVVLNFQHSQNYFSSWATVKHGVPYESVMGPLLFIFYTNYLPLNIRPISVVTMYADTSVLISKPNYNEFKNAFNFVLTHTVNWFRANQLILNMDKIL